MESPVRLMLAVFLMALFAGAGILSVPAHGHSPICPMMDWDQDRDGLDDRLEDGSVDLPVWTFVHFRPSEIRPSLLLGSIDRSGAELGRIYDIVPVASVRIGSVSQAREILSIRGVFQIEVQEAVRPILDVSSRAVKANPSAEYSPQTARELGFTGKGITIAIIDTGVDNEHPSLQGSFIAGADLSVPESPLTPRDGSFDPDDRSGHGTGVASIALGRGDSEGNMRGIAPEAGLIDLKVTGASPVTLNQNSLMDALQWCKDNRDTDWGSGYSGVDIVSMSLGTGNEQGAVAQAMDELVGMGIVVVQGAGNTGAQYGSDTGTVWSDRSIVVGVIDDQDTVDRDDDEIWSSSTYGPRTDDGDNNPYDELRPDVVAPGVSIGFASSSRISSIQGAEGWSSGSGSSYATPHVSGTIALMLQAKKTIRPDENTNPVAQLIHQSSEPRGEPFDETLSPGYSPKYGFGILDSYQAVKLSLSYTSINHRPEIKYFAVEPNVTTAGSTCRVRVIATDMDEEPLSYILQIDDGTLSGEGPIWDWVAPSDPGKYYFNLEVRDQRGGKDTSSTYVLVEEGAPNRPPVITSFRAADSILSVGGTTTLRTVALDQDEDELAYDYVAARGSIQGEGDEVIYSAPDQAVKDTVTVTVSDGKGGTDSRTLQIDVREEDTNRAPSITLLKLDPPIINLNTSGQDVKLDAQVLDPDGLEDIDQVIADLTSIGGLSGVDMKNDGIPPDDMEGDLEFTLLLEGIDLLDNGTYTIRVTVYDMAGESQTGTVPLIIDIPSQSTDVAGSQGGMDTGLVVIIVIVVLLLVLTMAGILVSRSRSRRTSPVNPYSGGPVNPAFGATGYQNQGPQYSPAPRFRPMDRR
ncbi:MAG: S8 family serine peptidase [Thermoplasmatota archaeon]